MSPLVAATEPRFTLAEGPLWDCPRARVLWVDIAEGLVLAGRLEEDRLRVVAEWSFEGYVGAVRPAADGALLVARTRGLARLEPDGTVADTLVLDDLGPDDRLNDATCDAAGRVLVGTLSLTGDGSPQRLLQVGPDGVRVLDDDLGLANGMGFSPDGTVLYSVDSAPGAVRARDYDQATGAVGPRRDLLDLRDTVPDGMTVDADGRLWVALWGPGQVRCYSPDGRLLEVLDVPAPHVTSVAFVGDDLDRLLVTTARQGLDPAALDAAPLSGSLFLARPGCRGLPASPWSGRLGP